MTEAKCEVCKRVKMVYVVCNGFHCCPRCGVSTAKIAYDGMEHRYTVEEVDTLLGRLTESIKVRFTAAERENEYLKSRIATLEACLDVTPAEPVNKAEEIRKLLEAEPDLTVRQIQERLHFNKEAIKSTVRRVRKGS